jgi:hypothetical protein
MMLVSLKQAKDHLNIDTDDKDDDVYQKIFGASAMVVNYLKSAADVFLDTNGEPEMDSMNEPVGVPDEVQSATLLMIGYLYRDRDGDTDKAYEMGYLPRPVTAILTPLRKPAMA